VLEALDRQQRRDAEELARMGDLAWMLDDHQETRIYDHYRDFECRMHDYEGDGFYNCWMLDAGRQVGKTFTTSLIRVEDCIRWPNSRYMMACAEEVSLSEFIIPNIDTIIDYLPEDIRPNFIRHHRGMKAAYWFPNGSVLKLVGIDKNPKGLRGPKCDGASIHEAAFPTKLAKVVVGVIQPQFQRGRDPTLILESSAPEDADHDFDTVFKPSCERRKAYVFMTIDDNTALSQRKKDAILSAAREIDAEDAEREYYGKRVRNKMSTVFPEVAEHMKLSTYTLPQNGLAITTLDPGQVHLFGITWSTYDVTRGQVVFIDDWAESNPNTERVAAVTAAREYDLFGTPPNPKLSRIPLDDEYDNSGQARALGWRSLLRGDRTEHLAGRLHSLSQRTSGMEKSDYQWFDNDLKDYRSNPMARVSDTQLQLINDLSTIYGMHVTPTTKDDLKDTMVMLARAKMAQGKVAFGPLAEMTYKHVHAAQWNKLRTKFEEHNLYGHVDLAACVIYALRFWEQLYNVLPTAPEHFHKAKTESWVPQPQWETEDEDDGGMW
jgi:hypothetical protein